MGPLAAEPTAPDVSDTQTYPRVRRHCPTDIGHPSGELNARSGMCWTVRSSENAFVEHLRKQGYSSTAVTTSES